MKTFLAAMAMLFTTVLAIWVAFRLAPETWAMMAGVVFGLLASLPMFGIVALLLLRGNRRPAEPVAVAPPIYYPPQPYALPPSYAPYAPLPAAPEGYYLPAPAHAPPRSAPLQTVAAPRAYIDRTPAPYAPAPAYPWDAAPPAWIESAADPADEPEWDAPAQYPAPARRREARILGH
ncbi:MAG: hypothetical protein M3Z04_09915 [Chloroflexota bacterium]|nr:hypothetical protein [Chloroflexota bacterium]